MVLNIISECPSVHRLLASAGQSMVQKHGSLEATKVSFQTIYEVNQRQKH